MDTPNNVKPNQEATARPISEDEIDLRQLVNTILQHGRLGLSVAAGVIVAGLVYLFLATPIYKADSLVEIEQHRLGLSLIQDMTSILGASTTDVQTEMDIMNSRSVLGGAVQEQNLEISAQPRRFPLFGDALARHRVGRVLRHIGGGYAWDDERIDVGRLEVPGSFMEVPLILRAGQAGHYVLDDPDGKLLLSGEVGKAVTTTVADGTITVFVRDIRADPGVEFVVTARRLDMVLNDLQQNFDVSQNTKKQSNLIQLSLTGTDPNFVANVLNSITNSYIRQNVEARSEQASKSLDFLDQQLPDLKQQLTVTEAALADYQSHEGSGVDLTVTDRNLLEKTTLVETNISALKLQLAELKFRFTDASPTVQAVQQQLDILEARKADIEGQLSTLPKSDLQAIRLMRDAKVANDLYLSVLNQAEGFKISKAGTVGDARIVDTAVRPWQKDWPKTPQVLAFTLVLAIFSGIGAIFARVALRRALETSDQIEAKLGLPVFATIPHSNVEHDLRRKMLLGGTSPLLCREVPHEPAVESLRSLRTSLQFALLEAKNNIVAIHGPTPALGKSFVAANLAFLLSDTEKSVLLIDADMRKGHIHKTLSKPRSPGLSEVIAGTCKLDTAVHVFCEGRLKFLSTGKLPPNPAELLTHGNFHALLQQASESFDFVVIDSPPTLNLADSISIGKLSGVNFLVVRGGVSTLQDVQIAQRRMDQNGIRIDGIIFNDLSALASKYGYGGYYAYKYKSEAA